MIILHILFVYFVCIWLNCCTQAEGEKTKRIAYAIIIIDIIEVLDFLDKKRERA
jgi:hypothetical protein